MGFFGGPSKGVLLQMSQGVAAVAMQISMLSQVSDSEKASMINGMKAEGSPTDMNELVEMAASVVREHNLGWYKKNQFLGMIYGSLLNAGFSAADARHLKGQIEILS